MGPNICIVIPTHNRNDLLQRTLDSLGQCERTNAPVTLYIIENGGKHGAESVARSAASWLNVQYRYSELPNKSRALNQLLDEISDELVVFFDDDVRISPSTLIAYEVAAASCGPGVYFGGPMGVDYESSPPEWLRKFLPPSATGMPVEDINVSKPTPFLGCNWAAYAVDMRRGGGFDPEVGPGGKSGGLGQETSMQKTLYWIGCRPFLVTEAMVWHYVPSNRCSTDWALNRAYRGGISVGIHARNSGPTIFGYPRWLLKRHLGALLTLPLRLVHPRPGKRFGARIELAHINGQLHGSRELSAQQEPV